MLTACGGGSSAASVTLTGSVASAKFTPGSATDPTVAASYWQGAQVCVDANNNGRCDASENPVTTSSTGAFSLTTSSASAIIADIGTTATMSNGGAKNPTRTVYRASIDQVNEQGSQIILSPLSTEVVRMMEANSTSYQTEKQNLASRLSVTTAQVLADVNTVTGTAQTALLREAHQ